MHLIRFDTNIKIQLALDPNNLNQTSKQEINIHNLHNFQYNWPKTSNDPHRS